MGVGRLALVPRVRRISATRQPRASEAGTSSLSTIRTVSMVLRGSEEPLILKRLLQKAMDGWAMRGRCQDLILDTAAQTSRGRIIRGSWLLIWLARTPLGGRL